MFKKSFAKLNNRGASLVSVIVAMTVVALLGVLILSVSYTNFNMKVIDRNSKNNFYTAESVLDDLIAELEAQMSVQYINAYSAVMADYGTFENATDASRPLADEMASAFRQEFVVDMATCLAEDKTTLDTFDISKLGVTYITVEEDGEEVQKPVSKFDAKYPGTILISSSDRRLLMYEERDGEGKDAPIKSAGIILKEVSVYYEENGYANTVTTDIRIQAPAITFSQIVNMPDISDFAYIAQGSVDVSGNNITLAINGNAFSGANANGKGVTIGNGAKLDASGAPLLISEGDVVLSGASGLTTGAATSFWTKGILANGSTKYAEALNIVELEGRSYVKDDLTLEGRANQVKLAGEYYGFSASASSAADSSAIIINGADSNLDMSGLSTMVLAGSAFVSATSADKDNENDVMIGNSVAVKGDQIAYLVPTTCSGIVSNPMKKSQYEILAATANWERKALETLIPEMGRNLYYYDSNVKIVPVFYTSAHEAEKTVYLYLKFSSTSYAKAYFSDLLEKDAAASDRLKNYLNNFISDFAFMDGVSGTDYSLITNGNYLTKGEAYNVTKPDGTVEICYRAAYADSNTSNVESSQALTNYTSSFASLCSNLTTTSSGGSAASGTAYDNVVYNDKVVALGSFSGNIGDVYAIVTNGNYVFPSSMSGKGGVILATGDVTISGNYTWNGVIICGGKLTVTGGATLNANALNVSTAMGMETTPAGSPTPAYVYNLFVGGDNYSANKGQNDSDDASDIRDCLILENYKAE